MDWMLVAIVAVVALALLFDFTNGSHDAANSVATVVATRAMPARRAIPSTVVIGWVMFELTALPAAAAFVAVGAVLFVLFGWIAWAMSKALRACDVAAEIPTEAELREPVSAVPHIEGHGPLV